MQWKMSGLLRESLRNGDENQFRGLFARRGYEMGIYCPCVERIVMEEVLAGRAPLGLLLIFFKELGGRFILSKERCVWTELISIDAQQHARAMPGMVSVLTDLLQLPLPCADLLRVACEERGWNVLLALGPRLKTPGEFEVELIEIWGPRLLHLSQERAAEGWVAQVLFPLLSDRGLMQILRGQKQMRRTSAGILAVLSKEVQRRKEMLLHKQEMLLMPKCNGAPSGLERVFSVSHLAHHIIQELAFKEDIECLAEIQNTSILGRNSV